MARDEFEKHDRLIRLMRELALFQAQPRGLTTAQIGEKMGISQRQAQRDIAAWFALLQQRGASECHLLGICSGAYHGFKAAVAGLPLASVLAINPLVFFWRDGMPLDPPLSEPGVMRMATVYQKSARDPSKWLRLLTGRVDVAQLARVMSRRARTRARHALRGLARAVGIPLHDDLVAELRTVQARGARLRLILSDGDPSTRLTAAMGFEDASWRPGLVGARAADILTAALESCGLDEHDPRYVRDELEAQLSMEAESGAGRDWRVERRMWLSVDPTRQ